MSIFRDTIIRNSEGRIRTEDDMTQEIRDFFEDQEEVISYSQRNEGKCFFVSVDGSVHINKENLGQVVSLFKLEKVTGDLVFHGITQIDPEIIPANLGGMIFIDVESIMPKQPASTPQAEQDDDFYDDGLMAFNSKAPDKPTIEKEIKSFLVDSDEGMSLDELKRLWDEANELRKRTYVLSVSFKTIQLKKGNGQKIEPEFTIKDDEDKTYSFELETKQAAIYLTFLYLKKGILLETFCEANGVPHRTCFRICRWLVGKEARENDMMKSITIDKSTTEADKKKAIKTLTEYLSKIRNRIAKEMPNDRTARLFVISDNDKENYFSVPCSRDNIRNDIKKVFHLPELP